jgi:L-rhamnose mutarotase
VELVDLKAAVAAIEENAVNVRWQAQMGQYFEELGDRRPDEGFLQMEEIFHLD